MYFIQSNAAELLAASGPSPSSVQGRLAAQNYNVDVLIWVTNLEVRKLSGSLDKQTASPVQSPGAAFTPPNTCTYLIPLLVSRLL